MSESLPSGLTRGQRSDGAGDCGAASDQMTPGARATVRRARGAGREPGPEAWPGDFTACPIPGPGILSWSREALGAWGQRPADSGQWSAGAALWPGAVSV